MAEAGVGRAFSLGLHADSFLRLSFASGGDLTVDDAAALLDALAEVDSLLDEGPAPVLSFTDGAVAFDRDARRFVASYDGPTAVALVAQTAAGRVIGRAYSQLAKSTACPTRLFGSEEEAIHWLQSHKA